MVFRQAVRKIAASIQAENNSLETATRNMQRLLDAADALFVRSCVALVPTHPVTAVSREEQILSLSRSLVNHKGSLEVTPETSNICSYDLVSADECAKALHHAKWIEEALRRELPHSLAETKAVRFEQLLLFSGFNIAREAERERERAREFDYTRNI